MRSNYCWPLLKSRIAVIYGVLSSLDGTTQFIKLVWKNSSAFLKVRFLLVPRASREKSRSGGQLPPVTSLLPDFNGFGNSGVLGTRL